jgi:GntR family transcriptional regulator
LKIKPGAPVLTIRRSAIDMRGEAIELRISTVNTEKHEYFAELL